MNIPEHVAKAVLAEAGVGVPGGALATTPESAARTARLLGPVMVKAQIPMGGRGKSGGIRSAQTPEEAYRVAAELIGSRLGAHRVAELLVEELIPPPRNSTPQFSTTPPARRGGWCSPSVAEWTSRKRPVPIQS